MWTMYFDRSKTQEGSGSGCVLTDPLHRKHLISSHLEFECTTNTTEYEALVLGLQKAINLNVVVLKVAGDLEIVVWIDKDEHEQSLQDAADARKGNIIPKGGVSLEKMYELHNHFQGLVNPKTHSSTLFHEQINLGTNKDSQFVNLGTCCTSQ
eukprot:PITA_23107